jgi:rhodanese-related sulfurtransferase
MIAWKPLGAMVLVLAGAGLLAVPPPPPGTPTAQALKKAQEKVASRELHVDPGEIMDLVHDDLVKTQIVDVRSEADFNLFHLKDAIRLGPKVRNLDPSVVKFLVDNDEANAEKAAMDLIAHGVINVYIMEGGLNRWLQWVEADEAPDAGTLPGPKADNTLRWKFQAALGVRHPASDPDYEHVPVRLFESKVKIAKSKAGAGGGCG